MIGRESEWAGRGGMFTEMKWYGMGDLNSTEHASIIFLQYFTMLLKYVRKAHVYNTFTICSQGTCFTIVFTIHLQYFYNMFARRVFTIFLQCARKARVLQ